jgi:antitoxin (DNA-binding transcriptional repressor) of toxin-antitoxin stability system
MRDATATELRHNLAALLDEARSGTEITIEEETASDD